MVCAQGLGRRSVWIYDIIIHEDFRRKDYASRTLDLVEERTRDLGVKSVELHVFGHNRGAQALYEKLGYNNNEHHHGQAHTHRAGLKST